MAQTILTQPTTPNGTLTNLVYAVSSSNAGEPQFSFLADIYYSGSATRLARINFSPNTFGVGVIDLAKTFNNYLDYDNFWEITGSLIATSSSAKFEIQFGEQYGVSLSSSITIYPSQSSANIIDVIPAVIEPDAGSYNFNTSSFEFSTALSYPASSYNAIRGVRLSDYPYGLYGYTYDITTTNTTYKPVTKDDYETISFINGQGFNTVQVDVVNFGTGSVSANIATGSDYSVGDFITIGIGPKNLTDYTGSFAGIITGSNWDYIQVQITPPSGESGYATYFYVNAESDRTQFFNPSFTPCNYPQTRLAWINKYGVWDYYNIWNPITRSTNIDRNTFKQSFVNYSENNSIYDISRRGKKQYYSQFIDNYSITTNYIPEIESDWLSQLFESPSVYVQTENGFVPINITTASYIWKTNPRGQKTFQYTFDYQYSNNRRPIY